jgi:hypothetical protein
VVGEKIRSWAVASPDMFGKLSLMGRKYSISWLFLSEQGHKQNGLLASKIRMKPKGWPSIWRDVAVLLRCGALVHTATALATQKTSLN